MASTKDKQGYLLIAVVGAILCAFFVFKFTQDRKPRPGVDNCVGTVTANTVIVIDLSEQMSDQTRNEIVARAMSHIRDRVAVNERVSVFTISDLSRRSLKPVESRCRPPSDANRLTENAEMVRKAFIQNFEKPIRQALAVPPGESKESPIAQALTDISLSHYLRAERNTLLVFSDMLENTSKYSLYGCTVPAETVARYRESRRGAQERPEFHNTQVFLNLVPRLDQPKGALKCRDQLWPWFFGDNKGATANLTVDYLPGGATTDPKIKGTKL